jgi:hypothetical protein
MARYGNSDRAAKHRIRRFLSHGRGLDTASKWAADWAEWKRILGLVGRARYPGWTLSVERTSPRRLVAFHSAEGEPGALAMSGPWPIPDGADEAQIAALCLAAVVEVEGESARDRFRFLPGPEK